MSSIQKITRKATALLRRRGASVDDAADYVQEAFLRVCKYEESQRVRSKEALIIKTAVNISVDSARRKSHVERQPAFDWTEISDPAPQPDEVTYQKAKLEYLSVGLQKLSERERRILLAKRLDGQGTQLIADREKMSVAAVEKQIARATLKLMRWMEQW